MSSVEAFSAFLCEKSQVRAATNSEQYLLHSRCCGYGGSLHRPICLVSTDGLMRVLKQHGVPANARMLGNLLCTERAHQAADVHIDMTVPFPTQLPDGDDYIDMVDIVTTNIPHDAWQQGTLCTEWQSFKGSIQAAVHGGRPDGMHRQQDSTTDGTQKKLGMFLGFVSVAQGEGYAVPQVPGPTLQWCLDSHLLAEYAALLHTKVAMGHMLASSTGEYLKAIRLVLRWYLKHNSQCEGVISRLITCLSMVGCQLREAYRLEKPSLASLQDEGLLYDYFSVEEQLRERVACLLQEADNMMYWDPEMARELHNLLLVAMSVGVPMPLRPAALWYCSVGGECLCAAHPEKYRHRCGNSSCRGNRFDILHNGSIQACFPHHKTEGDAWVNVLPAWIGAAVRVYIRRARACLHPPPHVKSFFLRPSDSHAYSTADALSSHVTRLTHSMGFTERPVGSRMRRRAGVVAVAPSLTDEEFDGLGLIMQSSGTKVRSSYHYEFKQMLMGRVADKIEHLYAQHQQCMASTSDGLNAEDPNRSITSSSPSCTSLTPSSGSPPLTLQASESPQDHPQPAQELSSVNAKPVLLLGVLGQTQKHKKRASAMSPALRDSVLAKIANIRKYGRPSV